MTAEDFKNYSIKEGVNPSDYERQMGSVFLSKIWVLNAGDMVASGIHSGRKVRVEVVDGQLMIRDQHHYE